jgi:NAD(P)H-hydrate epimerase
MDVPLILSREQSRRIDSLAITAYGIPGIVLMENAGRGVVDVLLEVDPQLATNGSVAILCGKGNNAGDGFVIARHLDVRGVAVQTLLLCPPGELAGDARANYDILVSAALPIVDLSSAAGVDAMALPMLLDRHAGRASWLVDALLGTGAVGEPRDPFRTAIAWMNARAAQRLAVDVPSGLDCDSGEAPGQAARAHVTCTFVAAKPGLVRPCAAPWVGDLRVVSIGVPRRLVIEIVEPD